MLDAFAQLCSRRPPAVLAAGAASLIIAVLAGSGALGRLAAVPLVDSSGEAAAAERTLADGLGHDPGPALLVRVLGDAPLTGADGRIVLDTLAAQAEADPDVGAVRHAGTSPDGLAAGLLIHLREGLTQAESEAVTERLREDFDPGPFRLEITGRVQVLAEAESSARHQAGEGLFFGLPLAALLLLAGFAGSFLAALGAVLVGGIAVAGSFTGLRLLDGTALDLAAPGLPAGAIVGGVLAIEHTRTYISAYRDAARLVGVGPDAIALASVEAGRAVAAATAAAIAALLPLLLLGIDPLADIILAATLAVLLAAAGAITLMPPLLAVTGPRLLGAIESEEAPGREGRESPAGRVARSGRLALAGLVASLALLAVLASQAPGGSVGFDASGLRSGSEARTAEAAATRTLGPGLTAPAVVALDPKRAEMYAQIAGRLDTVVDVEEPRSAGTQHALVEVRLAGSSGSLIAQDAVESLRAIGGDHEVGGQTATLVDARKAATGRLAPAALLALLGVAFTVLIALRPATGLLAGLPLAAGLAVLSAAPLAAGVGVLAFLITEGRLSGLLSYEPIGALHLATLVLTPAVIAPLLMARTGAFAACLSEERQSGASRAGAIIAAGARMRAAHITSTVVAATLLGALALRVDLLAAKEAALLAAAILITDLLLVRSLAIPALTRLATRGGDR